eukprot:462349-Prymnesium_polylepis.1
MALGRLSASPCPSSSVFEVAIRRPEAWIGITHPAPPAAAPTRPFIPLAPLVAPQHPCSAATLQVRPPQPVRPRGAPKPPRVQKGAQSTPDVRPPPTPQGR